MKKIYIILLVSFSIFSCDTPTDPDYTEHISIIHTSYGWRYSSASPDSSEISAHYVVRNTTGDAIAHWECGFNFVFHDGSSLILIDEEYQILGQGDTAHASVSRQIDRSEKYHTAFLEFLRN